MYCDLWPYVWLVFKRFLIKSGLYWRAYGISFRTFQFLYSFQAVPQAVQNNTQVKHHSEVTLNALNAEVDVEGSLDFDSAPPNV